MLVAGPSGSGKDTLIQAARENLRDNPGFVFPRRVVTRPPSEAEESEFCEPGRFAEIAAAGGFAIAWTAHGLSYGIPALVKADLAAGRAVVCNVSRTVIPELRLSYPRVMFVEVTAPHELLLERLATRRRPEDGCIQRRIRRSAMLEPIDPDTTVVNDGSIEVAVARFIQAIRESSTY